MLDALILAAALKLASEANKPPKRTSRNAGPQLECAHMDEFQRGACDSCKFPLRPRYVPKTTSTTAKIRHNTKQAAKTPLLLKQAMRANQAERSRASNGWCSRYLFQ